MLKVTFYLLGLTKCRIICCKKNVPFSHYAVIILIFGLQELINPFAPGDFAQKRVLKLVEWFSGHCRALKS